jgi:dynein heavy chain
VCLFPIQATNLAEVFGEGGNTTPLIFILSVGTDPAAALYKFADEMKMMKKMAAISLGQGQVCGCCFLFSLAVL